MALDRDKFHISFITFLVFCVSFPWLEASQCLDGTYPHGSLQCCLCSIGRGLVEHCTEDLTYGKCEGCSPNMFSSSPSNMPCERCTSCSHANENLEEEEACTRGQDRKCRCKKDHYCVSGTEGCKLCHECKQCGDLGVKVACSGRNDTVCNEQTQSGPNVAGIIVAALLLALGVAAVAFWRWKKRKTDNARDVRNGHNVEMQEPLTVPRVNLEPFLEDIAAEIGWRDMEHVAMRSGIQNGLIEACKWDHHGDSQEQTIKLLRMWVEREGMDAGGKLITRLEQGSKKKKAQTVRNILNNSSDVNPSSAGS